jgi:hypothetical protein
MRLGHPCRGDAREKRERGDDLHGDRQAKRIRRGACHEGAGNVPGIPPQAIHADRSRTPFRVLYIADHGQQCRIHHRRTDAEKHGATDPRLTPTDYRTHPSNARKQIANEKIAQIGVRYTIWIKRIRTAAAYKQPDYR